MCGAFLFLMGYWIDDGWCCVFSPKLSHSSHWIFSRDCDLDEVSSCVWTIPTLIDFLWVAVHAKGEVRP